MNMNNNNICLKIVMEIICSVMRTSACIIHGVCREVPRGHIHNHQSFRRADEAVVQVVQRKAHRWGAYVTLTSAASHRGCSETVKYVANIQQCVSSRAK